MLPLLYGYIYAGGFFLALSVATVYYDYKDIYVALITDLFAESN